MESTNKYNLPEPLYKALYRAPYKPVEHRIANTALIAAPLERVLKMKYWDKIPQEVSDNMWALLGQAVHYIIEKNAGTDTAEIKSEYVHPLGATIVTRADHYKDGVVTDWKVTSVFSFLLGDKLEWVRQLNVIKYIFDRQGKPVDKLKICAILRDWTKSKVYDAGYPTIPFVEKDIDVMQSNDLEQYVDERVRLHLDAEAMIDHIEAIPICTEEERWSRPTTFAVKKSGQERAVRVLTSIEEAEKYIAASRERDKLHIEKRLGADIKCDQYCGVKPFCPYRSGDAS
jgi:hypothetical protein